MKKFFFRSENSIYNWLHKHFSMFAFPSFVLSCSFSFFCSTLKCVNEANLCNTSAYRTDLIGLIKTRSEHWLLNNWSFSCSVTKSTKFSCIALGSLCVDKKRHWQSFLFFTLSLLQLSYDICCRFIRWIVWYVYGLVWYRLVEIDHSNRLLQLTKR